MQVRKTVIMGGLLLVAACDAGARSHAVPWDTGSTRVIDGDRNVSELAAPTGSECLGLSSDACIKPQEECAGQAADVVLDAQGNLLEVVCYPEAATLSVEQLEAQQGELAQNQNDSVIVLDNVDDGVDIAGDVSVDANNVVIYGESPETAIVEGDVDVDGNNIIVRGVRIQGDVQVVANNAVFLQCVIEGDVTILGNNAVLSACDVLGDVSIKGNNARLTGNHIGGELHDAGKNTACEDNRAAEDENNDGVLDEAELGEVLTCAE